MAKAALKEEKPLNQVFSDQYNLPAPTPVAQPAPLRLILTAETSIAHGDTSPKADSDNQTLFNRELCRIRRERLGATPEQVEQALRELFTVFKFGTTAQPLLESLSGGTLIASVFVSRFIALYGQGDGTGLFAGLDRYRYLSTRLHNGVAATSTLSSLFSYVALKLNLPMFSARDFAQMRALFTLPVALQTAAIQAIGRELHLVVLAAQELVGSEKRQSEAYAEKAGEETEDAFSYTATPAQIAQLVQANAETLAVLVPALSSNALRHCAVREPLTVRLLQSLGISTDQPIPRGVERFLFGGGNTVSGAKAPGAADLIEAVVRRNYPAIDAVGGSFDNFLLTESKVSLANWIICAEHAETTARLFGRQSTESVFDLIKDTTRTRMSLSTLKDKDSGQMIFSYETLAAGAEIGLEIRFAPWTSPLTIGAVSLALKDWLEDGGSFGASAARGHGRLRGEWLKFPEASYQDQYLAFLETHQQQLAAGLLDGTFGTGGTLCGLKD